MMAIAKSRLWFAVFLIIVFLLGIGTGLTVDRFADPGPRGPRGFGRMGPGPRPAALADRMSRELNLSSTQREQLEQVFVRGAERLENYRRDSRRQFASLSRQLNSEVEAVLTPEQRERFRAMRRERPRRGPGR
jgi:Spy/CpxP family protein refolding chaperone